MKGISGSRSGATGGISTIFEGFPFRRCATLCSRVSMSCHEGENLLGRRPENTNQHQPMKTNRTTAMIAAILSLLLSGPMWAAPRGKHVIEKHPHKHGVEGGKDYDGSDRILKRTGPPGKSFPGSRFARRR